MAKEVKKLQVPEEDLKALGLDVNYIKEHDADTWKALESGKKTKLLSLTADFGVQKISTAARIHLWEDAAGNVKPYIHTVRPTVNLSPYKGYEFSKEDMGMLLNENRHMLNHPVMLKFGEKNIQCLVGVDKETNEIIHIPTNNIYIHNECFGREISPEEKTILKNGGCIYGTFQFNDKEEPKEAIVRFDINKNNTQGGLKYLTPNPRLIQEARAYSSGIKVEHKEKVSKEEKKQEAPVEKQKPREKQKKSGPKL